MNVNEALIDLLEDNRRRLCRLLNTISDECLYWKPEADANSIIVTMWHMGRISDVFLILQAKGCASEEECWFRNGWAEQTGYDPRGAGQRRNLLYPCKVGATKKTTSIAEIMVYNC